MIAEILKEGRGQALSSEYLASITELDPRNLRKQISREREAGAVIISSAAGYYLPANRQEIEQFVKGMKRRGRSAFKAAAAAAARLKDLGGQMYFEEENEND